MNLDRKLFDSVTSEAKQSQRLRMNFDMRNSSADGSQRMLNAIEPGTILPIHRHKKSSETCIILRGAAEEIFYDEHGNETERVYLEPAGDCCGVNIEVGRWHKIVALKPGIVIFEAKDGAYEPTTPNDILNV